MAKNSVTALHQRAETTRAVAAAARTTTKPHRGGSIHRKGSRNMRRPLDWGCWGGRQRGGRPPARAGELVRCGWHAGNSDLQDGAQQFDAEPDEISGTRELQGAIGR